MKKLILLFALLFFTIPPCHSQQVITTFAGIYDLSYIFSGDGVPATTAHLAEPVDICADASGNIYISEFENCCVRKVNPTGIITTVAGLGGVSMSGYSGDGGPATIAKLRGVADICFDGSGNLYIADYGNNCIRKVSIAGIITTIAGTGSPGFTADGHAATASLLYKPYGICIDGSGIVYFSEQGNNCVRKIDASGIISTIAGTGGAADGFGGDDGPATAALLNTPCGIIMDGSGNLFIADEDNYRVRKVSSSGYITTVAGTGSVGFSGDGFAATTAKLNYPLNLFMDGSGNLYIADFSNNAVRMVNAAGIISTVAGIGGSSGYTGDGSAPTATQLGGPTGVYIDASGNMYISDEGNTVRKICTPPPLATITGTGSAICPSASLSLTGGAWGVVTGNASVTPAGTAATATGISGGVDTITYTLTNSCYFTSAKYPVTVNPAPYASAISGSPSLCLGATDTLADSVAGGVWYPGPSGVAAVGPAGASSTAVTGIAAGTGVITYSVTNSCGTAAAVFPITVNLLPVAGGISGAAAFCAGSSLPLSASVPGGVWSSALPAIGTVAASGSVTGISAGTDTIKYTVTNGCGTAVATSTVTVNALPVAGSITGAASVCTGAATPLSVTATGGTWSSSTPTTGTIDAAGNVTGIAAGVAGIAYTVTNGCGTAVATATVTVIPLPVAGTITGSVPICALSTIPLSDTVATGSGTWSSGSPGIASVSSAGVVTGLSAGTSVISYSVSNACGVAVDTTTVIVVTFPAAGTITGADTVCQGATLHLSDAVPGGVWGSATAGVATVSGAGVVSGVAGGTGIISYSVTNACGTAATTTAITVDPLPVVGAISGSTAVCALASTTPLADATTGGVWGSSNAAIATVGSATGIVTGVSFGNAIIYYTVTNSCGSTRASVSVTVNTTPDAGLLTADKYITCPLDTTHMKDTITGGTWSSSNPGIASVNSSGIVTGETIGGAIISYTVTNSCGASHALFSMEVVPCTDTGAGVGIAPVTSASPAHLIVSPNPSGGTFGITLPYSSNETATVTITNILGEQIKTFTLPTNKEQQIKTGAPPGAYTITATVNGERFTEKIVVQ